MEIITSLYFLVLFAIAGYSDFKRHEVDDIVSSCFWLSLVACGLDLWLAGFVFALLFGLNSLYNRFTNGIIFSWADILIIPSFVVLAYPTLSSLVVVPILLPVLVHYVVKREQPLVTYLFIGYLCVVVLSLVHTVV